MRGYWYVNSVLPGLVPSERVIAKNRHCHKEWIREWMKNISRMERGKALRKRKSSNEHLRSKLSFSNRNWRQPFLL